MIIKNYHKTMYNNGYELNKRMGYLDFKKEENCRYYLFPTYIDITDYFTDEEIVNNFYIGDLWEIDYNEEPSADPEDYFGFEWTKEYGILRKWEIDISEN